MAKFPELPHNTLKLGFASNLPGFRQCFFLVGAIVDGSEIWQTHQLRLVVYLIIHRVLYIPGGARFLPSTVSPKFLSHFGIVHLT